jgi:hypothetical protein
MGGWTIMHDGEWYSLPFDFEFPSSRQKAELPDAVTVTVDERDFNRVLGDDATWGDRRRAVPGPSLLS